MQELLKDIYKKHDIWVDIVMSFGCKKYYAEDIVQEMYIKIIRYFNKGLNIDYGNEDYNYYYIFLTLKSLFLNLKKKENRVKFLHIDQFNTSNNTDKDYCKYDISKDYDVDYDKSYIKVKKELKKMYWYDKKVFEMIEAGQSIATLSRKTKIPYHSLYNTYRKVVEKLKHII